MKVYNSYESEPVTVFKDVPYVNLCFSVNEAVVLREYLRDPFVGLSRSNEAVLLALSVNLREAIKTIQDDQVSSMSTPVNNHKEAWEGK